MPLISFSNENGSAIFIFYARPQGSHLAVHMKTRMMRFATGPTHENTSLSS
jgi:hypothetical protein